MIDNELQILLDNEYEYLNKLRTQGIKYREKKTNILVYWMKGVNDGFQRCNIIMAEKLERKYTEDDYFSIKRKIQIFWTHMILDFIIS